MRVAEMGCGTGAFSVRLARDGAKLVATDLSQEMIERAQVRAREAGAGVQFAVMDMERFALPRKVEAVFCACDGVNYLTSPDKVRRCFAGVFESLKPGGGSPSTSPARQSSRAWRGRCTARIGKP